MEIEALVKVHLLAIMDDNSNKLLAEERDYDSKTPSKRY
ncbi:hypothetical protein OSCI_3430013 [Kamptonema sp. PCC 6506]|nr:hypothetical protein OSCI_3430013 [Kamptonema sp. PCC 6506]